MIAEAESPLGKDLLWLALRCRRTRSASACFSRPSGAARRARCRRVACQRRTNRRHSGSWQYHWFHCRARYRRPHPLRRQVRHPSRRPGVWRWLAGSELSLVSCLHPTGGYDSLGPPGEDAVHPPRALYPCRLVFLRPPPSGDHLPPIRPCAGARRKPRVGRRDAFRRWRGCQAARRKPGRRRTRCIWPRRRWKKTVPRKKTRLRRRQKETRRRITVRDSALGEGVVQPEIGGVFKPVVTRL